MKFITNFKDYYDFIIGKYGIDEKCVYKRTNSYNPNFHTEPSKYRAFQINFCNTTYYGHYYQGKFYYGKEAENHIPRKIDVYTYRGKCEDPILFNPKNQYSKISINEALNCPVILNGYFDYNQTLEGICNIRLWDFGFNKVIDPETAYITISNFIMREKQITDNQTNKEKIISHGFDFKTSFRNM